MITYNFLSIYNHQFINFIKGFAPENDYFYFIL